MTAGNGGDLVGGFGSHHAGAITETSWGGTQTAGGNGQTANTSPSDFGIGGGNATSTVAGGRRRLVRWWKWKWSWAEVQDLF